MNVTSKGDGGGYRRRRPLFFHRRRLRYSHGHRNLLVIFLFSLWNPNILKLVITAGWLNLGLLFWSLRCQQIRYYNSSFEFTWKKTVDRKIKNFVSVSYSDIRTGLAGIHRASFIVSCSMTPHCNPFLFGLIWLFCVVLLYMQAKSVGRFGFQWGNQINFPNLILT